MGSTVLTPEELEILWMRVTEQYSGTADVITVQQANVDINWCQGGTPAMWLEFWEEEPTNEDGYFILNVPRNWCMLGP